MHHRTVGKTEVVFQTRLGFYFIFIFYLFFKNILFIHERHKEREREAETQAEGEAGSMQGAQHGTRSQDPEITT